MMKKLLYSYRNLPEKKRYIEFFTALLSVPVLLTVLLLNLSNLTGEKKTEAVAPNQEKIIVAVPTTKDLDEKPTPTLKEACVKELGPVEIIAPLEGVEVSDNPVSVRIKYSQGEYCAAVWAYRINGGRWSDYDDQSVSLYNLTSGNVDFELRVKSIVTGEEKTLKRSFVYKKEASDASEPKTATSSAN